MYSWGNKKSAAQVFFQNIRGIAMKCPHCLVVILQKIAGEDYYQCMACHGTWIPAGTPSFKKNSLPVVIGPLLDPLNKPFASPEDFPEDPPESPNRPINPKC
jgi:hypothetical protein